MRFEKQARRHFLLAAAVVGLSASAPARADYTIQVDKTQDRGTWEGWGCSLAWWAHVAGSSKHRDLYADLFFSRQNVPFLKHDLPGLGMNIVRYNIGGGGRRESFGNAQEKVPDELLWHRDIDGFWINWNSRDPNSASWDWSRDAGQRAMLQAAVKRGVDQVELFSNAPMWWMSSSKSSAGGTLQPWNNRDFAFYLAQVTRRAQESWGVQVDAVEPFNEPSAGWWNYPKNQEGSNIGREQQAQVLVALRQELDKLGLQKVGITASDENTMTAARETHEYFSQAPVEGQNRKVADIIDRVNVHSYNGLQPWRDNKARQSLRASVGRKKLWASEFGSNDGSGMALAQTVMEDINFLRPTAWLYWQPLEASSAWGLVNARFAEKPDDAENGAPTWAYTTHYVMAQFTRFLRPGHKIIGSSDNNSIAAHDADKRQLTLITINYGQPQRIEYDLSSLRSVGQSASITATNSNGEMLFQSSKMAVGGKRLSLETAPNSIYSIVVDGVDL